MPIATTDIQDVRMCSGCGASKPLDEFGIDRAQRNGRRTRCKICCRKATAEFAQRQPDYKREWQRRNPERVATYNRRQAERGLSSWHVRYPHVAAAMNLRRRARLATAAGVATAEQIAARIAYYGGKCWMCSASAVEIDHVKPLSKGGSNWPANLRPICLHCNRQKGATWPMAERAAA